MVSSTGSPAPRSIPSASALAHGTSLTGRQAQTARQGSLARLEATTRLPIARTSPSFHRKLPRERQDGPAGLTVPAFKSRWRSIGRRELHFRLPLWPVCQLEAANIADLQDLDGYHGRLQLDFIQRLLLPCSSRCAHRVRRRKLVKELPGPRR